MPISRFVCPHMCDSSGSSSGRSIEPAVRPYYGAGGAMDKRLPKVEAEVERSRAASALVLIDGNSDDAHTTHPIKATLKFVRTRANLTPFPSPTLTH